ncbi:electron transport complex protein RnfA [Chitinivibrio alkaliphilus]|uniref:Ion-translocating oxidoreductase complex subunit A n=1 Tax=Chitinivibrio alkaliphilus ACht1 TaxID=1313304 RepID=U7D6I0_9BACT|nr:RnfABCDGE type electron transport complex subunit A [Chitinivibrio alkaliphilus]ERP32124.1 electron transport complex, RnfABCDGE type, A subunit [Chitinivibrio alkaliphilus ACht1]
MDMVDLFIRVLQISVGAIFIENFVLTKFLGLCPFMGVSKKLSTASGMGMAVIFVMTIATLFTWPIYSFVLETSDTVFLQTVVFILVIASIVQLVEMILKKHSPILYESLGVFLPLITTNCAILGVTIINLGPNNFTASTESFTFFEALVNAFMSGGGFTLALVLMAGIREKIELDPIPKPFEGLPIAFITAGLLSIAFLGFSGMSF